MPALYFLGTRLLGQSPLLPYWSDSNPTPVSTAFFCPVCGELWGRVQVNTRHGWMAVTRHCSRHSGMVYPGGLFIHPWRQAPRAVEELPPEVLVRELSLWLTYDESTYEQDSIPCRADKKGDA